MLIEVLVAHPKQRFTSHPVAADGLLLVFGQADTDVVHSPVRHSYQVELVDDYRQTREDGLSSILVRAPHVDSQALNATAVLELMQPCSDQRLVSIGQHVDGNPVDYISDDAPELAINLRLINAQPFWQPRLVLGVESLDVVAGQGPDGFVIAANMLRDAQKSIAQALGLDVLDTPLRECRPMAG